MKTKSVTFKLASGEIIGTADIAEEKLSQISLPEAIFKAVALKGHAYFKVLSTTYAPEGIVLTVEQHVPIPVTTFVSAPYEPKKKTVRYSN